MTRPARPRSKTDQTPSLAQSAASAIAHRVFPVICGLWFAALFGLGAVAAGGEALAALAGHLRLTALVPAAAPPLGTTAHILIAAGLTGLGAVFGVLLGLALHTRAAGASLSPMARVKAGLARARTARPASKPDEPALAASADGTPAPTPTPRVRNRDAHPDAPTRRPLVVTEDVLPYHAPDAVREPVTPDRVVTTPPAWTSHVIESDAGHDPDGDSPLGGFMTGHPAGPVVEQAAEVPPFLAGNFGDAPPLAQPGTHGSDEAIVLPPETAAHSEFVHEHAASLPAAALATESVFHAAAPVFHASPPVFHASPTPLASQAVTAPHDPIVAVPVSSLGLVQLIERLALAITVRQAHRADAGHPATPAYDVGKTDEPLLRSKPSRLGRVDEAPVGETGPGGPLHDPAGHITAGRPDHSAAWADAAVDETLPPRFLRAPRDPQVAGTSTREAAIVTPEDTFVAPHSIFGAIPADDDVGSPQYSSLVNMAMVRPDLAARSSGGAATDAVYSNDPVVPFPVQAGDTAAPAPSDQADRALRDALATLRRMSAQR